MIHHRRRCRAQGVLSLAAILVPLFAAPARAQESAPVVEEKWPKLTLSPGLQMWRAAAATKAGAISDQPLIGAVVKAHTTFTDDLGAHVRAAYGANSFDTPVATYDVKGWAGAAGLDFIFAIGRRVQWYNTMGLGFQRVTLEDTDTNSAGAYFVTSLDVAMTSWMGMWMDWGCQVVGRTWAETAAGDAKTWHINPLGAGGFRFSL
ncbi:MAG: hypothetical protein AABZ30_08340 [Myxococcota bacterium]